MTTDIRNLLAVGGFPVIEDTTARPDSPEASTTSPSPLAKLRTRSRGFGSRPTTPLSAAPDKPPSDVLGEEHAQKRLTAVIWRHQDQNSLTQTGGVFCCNSVLLENEMSFVMNRREYVVMKETEDIDALAARTLDTLERLPVYAHLSEAFHSALERDDTTSLQQTSRSETTRILAQPATHKSAGNIAMSNLYTYRGIIRHASGQLDDAEQDFKHAVELYPSFDAHVHRTVCSLVGRRTKDAILQAQAARALDSNCPLTLHYLGIALATEGRHEEACEAFTHGLICVPHNPSFLMYRSLSYM
jgi:tetratricopeptide (TPR) repeat protein